MFLSKRRTVDLRRGICVFACLLPDELALLRGNDDVFQGINSVVAAGGGDLAAGDRDVSCADSVAVDVTVYARNCAADDIQNTVAGDGDIFIGDINTIAGVDFVSVVAIGPRDRVLAYQFNGKAGFTEDGGRSVVKKCTGTLGNRRAIQGQGAAVPFDVVVFRSRVRGRYCTVRSCHGVGRGGLRARQLHAAHVDVGVVRLSRTGCGDGEINRLECAGIVGFSYRRCTAR